jgi:hypothetical protein
MRLLVFTLMFIYHSAHNIGRTLATGLLARTSWPWLVAYTVTDHIVFQLYKVARRDLIYWVPGLGAAMSVLARFFGKAAHDFTGAPANLAAALASSRLSNASDH